MLLTYPACFYKEDDGRYSVILPDFNSATQGDNLADAIYMAEDAMAGLILDLIEEGKTIPKASEPTNDLLEPEEYGEGFVSMVLVDVDKKSKEFSDNMKMVKKTLNIPKWINNAAVKEQINFSQTLTEALLCKLSQ